MVDAAPSGSGLKPGQQVVAMMGEMGRTYDGSYAEYTSVPLTQVIPISTELPWEVIGALPEMIQTANGSLTIGLDLQPGETLLIRGGTSSVGLAAAALAKQLGATVLATTRRAERFDMLKQRGIDLPIIDTGEIADEVRRHFPDGVDAALELVGTPSLPDTLRCVRVHGTVCFTGLLSNQWTVKDFYPIDYIPAGVRLTAYEGRASTFPVRPCSGCSKQSPTAVCRSLCTTSTTDSKRSDKPTRKWKTTRQPASWSSGSALTSEEANRIDQDQPRSTRHPKSGSGPDRVRHGQQPRGVYRPGVRTSEEASDSPLTASRTPLLRARHPMAAAARS